MTNPADLVQEACDLLAGLFPRLERETAEPSAEGPAPGMHARAAVAPVPGDPPAFFAYTSIQSSARWAAELLLYAVGADEPRERWGGSDAVTVRLLTEVVPKLAPGADDDTFRLVLSELEQRLDEARKVPAIDEARHWRTLPRPRTCPYCACWFLKADMDARPVTIICFTLGCQDRNELRPVATMGTDGSGQPVLMWADGLTETVPDLESA